VHRKLNDTLAAVRQPINKLLAEKVPSGNRASGLLRIIDLDEKMEVENAATIQIAKKHWLMS
jgi:hypothetical protein